VPPAMIGAVVASGLLHAFVFAGFIFASAENLAVPLASAPVTPEQPAIEVDILADPTAGAPDGAATTDVPPSPQQAETQSEQPTEQAQPQSEATSATPPPPEHTEQAETPPQPPPTPAQAETAPPSPPTPQTPAMQATPPPPRWATAAARGNCST